MFNQKTTNFCNQLHTRLPIIQAPMAGGIVTPALIREVTKYGGLGSLPLGYLSLDEARHAIRATKALTTKPFAVNIFIPTPLAYPAQEQINNLLAPINQYRLAHDLPMLLDVTPSVEPDINDLLAMIVDEGIAIISMTFGILDHDAMAMLLSNNVLVMGTATTVQEGLALEAMGCHAVIAQGYEAGGHRGGGFLAQHNGGYIGTMALVPQMVDALTIPVIASGGIMDGRGIAAALMLGASAVQMGSAFLMCNESNASAMHKRLMLERPAESTCITSMFTGKPVRSFSNEFITMMEQKFDNNEVLPYPLQHQITKELRRKANDLGSLACAGLWGGQGTQLSRMLSVECLMMALEQEMVGAFSGK